MNIENFCQSFLKNFEARIFKLRIHLDNDLLYCGIVIQTYSIFPLLYLVIFLSFQDIFVTNFSGNLFGKHTENKMVYHRIVTRTHCPYSSSVYFFLFLSSHTL